jgi:hypothetical protein
MDVGREYTERWHHQMQIRDAVAAPPTLLDARWYWPLLDLSVRALSMSYAAVDAAPGTAVTFVVAAAPDGPDAGEGFRAWTVVRERGLCEGEVADAASVVRATADAAWRLLYNALPAPVLPPALVVDGDRRLAEPLLRARSVVV